MSDQPTKGAWAAGLATLTDAGRTLDVLFPEPHLGLDGAPHPTGTREHATDDRLASAARRDALRGVRTVPVATVIEDLARPPQDTADAYLRLHLLSHRLVRPREIALDGIFGVLPNVAWTSAGPVDPAELTDV